MRAELGIARAENGEFVRRLPETFEWAFYVRP
jgi:hypothetical protein